MHNVTVEGTNHAIEAKYMSVGQFAVIADGAYAGQVVVRGYDSIVSVTYPKNTWQPAGCCLKVNVLPRGSKITIVVVE